MHATPRHPTPCHAMPRHATPRNATPRHAMTCRATPCHAMPCHAMPCHAMPRHAMPRHAMPCHATPRHATPWHGAHSDPHNLTLPPPMAWCAQCSPRIEHRGRERRAARGGGEAAGGAWPREGSLPYIGILGMRCGGGHSYMGAGHAAAPPIVQRLAHHAPATGDVVERGRDGRGGEGRGGVGRGRERRAGHGLVGGWVDGWLVARAKPVVNRRGVMGRGGSCAMLCYAVLYCMMWLRSALLCYVT